MKKQLLRTLFLFFLLVVLDRYSTAQDSRQFKVFQFPADQIPVINGDPSDWEIVPDSFRVGMNEVWDDSRKHEQADPENLDFTVTVGWVKGMNRLYFLYEAYDNYWDFSKPGLHNDTFELIVDGDQSGGPFIDRFHPNKSLSEMEKYFSYHGAQAQNYHIFTPAEGKDWTLVWGSQPWIKELPYANVAYHYNFEPGGAGKLTLEFWITPFDYAGNEPFRAVESVLTENKFVGLCWAVIDYDDVNKDSNNGFWNLSKEHTMYGNASFALPFQLMPLDSRFRKPIEAEWAFKVLDPGQRRVAFIDHSYGEVTSWHWDFGDGQTSDEQNPLHEYAESGKYLVVLWVEGPKGKSRMAKLWDVAVR